jgi:predicted RNA-binding protein with PIN domain
MGLTRDDMFETLTETVFGGDEKTVALDTKLKTAITREMTRRSVKTVRTKKEDSADEETEQEDYVDSDDELDLDLVSF